MSKAKFKDVEIGQMFTAEGRNWVKVNANGARPCMSYYIGNEISFASNELIDAIEGQ